MTRKSGFARAQVLSRQRDRDIEKFLRRFQTTSDASILATGGYGREELAPHSDLDLLILVSDSGAIPAWVEPLIRHLWDRGFRVGHSVRTLEETQALMRTDMRTLSSLLDMRVLYGPTEIFDRLVQGIRAGWTQVPREEFLRRKWQERRQRLERLGRTVRMQEPDLKEGRGGLRDYQFIRWLVQTLGAAGRKNPWDVFPSLLGRGRTRTLRESVDWILILRDTLHRILNRPVERIGFADQERLADALGFHNTRAQNKAERMMSEYFAHAETVAAIAETGYYESVEARGRGRRRTYHRPIVDAPKLLREHLERGQEASDFLEELVFSLDRDPMPADLRAARNVLWEAFQDPILIGPLLRLYDRAGTLSQLFPAWRRVRHRIQHNFLHAYTIDEHLIRTVEESARLLRDPQWSDLHPRLLLAAAWLHDIGKGSEKDHSRAGAAIARTVLAKLRVSDAEQKEIPFLVRSHLTLSHTAQRRDIEDPRIVADFARSMKSRERVRLLHALTIADMRATGPNIFSDWKDILLHQLAQSTISRLDEGPPARARVSDRRKDLLAALNMRRRKPLSASTWGVFLREKPPIYLMRTTPEKISIDDELLHKVSKGSPAALFLESPKNSTTSQMTIVARDRAGLFSILTRVLALEGWNIRTAQIFTTNDGWVIDRFEVDGRVRFPEHLRRLEQFLVESVAAGRIRPEVLKKKRRGLSERPRPVVPVDVVVNGKTRRGQTTVEVYGPDRPGLLADVAHVMAEEGVSIHLARIATEGARVADFFYVTNRHGRPVGNEKAEVLRKRLLVTVSG